MGVKGSRGLAFDRALPAAAVAELVQRAVPKPDPGFDAAAGGTQSPFVRIRRFRDQIFDQLTPLRAMTVAVEFDVAIDVVDEMTQAIVVVSGIIGAARPGPNWLASSYAGQRLAHGAGTDRLSAPRFIGDAKAATLARRFEDARPPCKEGTDNRRQAVSV